MNKYDFELLQHLESEKSIGGKHYDIDLMFPIPYLEPKKSNSIKALTEYVKSFNDEMPEKLKHFHRRKAVITEDLIYKYVKSINKNNSVLRNYIFIMLIEEYTHLSQTELRHIPKRVWNVGNKIQKYLRKKQHRKYFLQIVLPCMEILDWQLIFQQKITEKLVAEAVLHLQEDGETNYYHAALAYISIHNLSRNAFNACIPIEISELTKTYFRWRLDASSDFYITELEMEIERRAYGGLD